ncbi:MAG TPA: FtsW/RodA/SpoVE family cell cycle protein [Solirubrobacteraceae bacterium]|nr:FtsW/RodA/SpoVE family cell cycle protein [Solirubrobacteraceae bacterium]
MLSARNRELLGLLPAALLVIAGFTAIYIQAEKNAPRASTNVTLNHASTVSLTYGAIFLALCLAAHVVIRRALPHADPYLFPVVAVLASVGIVMVYRINPTLARQQAQWFVVGLALFVATILALRRRGVGVLERYRYTIATAGIALALMPRLPGIGRQVNGAYLDIHVGSVAFQPAEFAKVAIVIFLASYLRDNRQLLVSAGRRVLGLTIPPMKQFGPMLVVWGVTMAVLLLTRELGTSLMFYGAFLALLYVATSRFSFPFIGLMLFALGAWLVIGNVGHVHARVLAWEHPFDPSLYNRTGGSYQLAQALFAQADGGLLGTGFDQSLLRLGGHGAPILPVPESDTIYAVITNELGLAGAAALLATYLLFVARGLRVAVLARDSFSKLLATGLSFVVAMQVFVIVGGVTRVIPLTGVTLPFVAYGGSSVVMNFVLVALLLLVSERARAPYEQRARS